MLFFFYSEGTSKESKYLKNNKIRMQAESQISVFFCEKNESEEENMSNENCKTIEGMMREMKIQTGENEVRSDKVIRCMANEMADCLLEDVNEKAAKQFLYIFSQMEEWTKKGMLNLSLEMTFMILRLFNYGEDAEMIAVLVNTTERQKMFAEAFIQCGKEICRSYTE